MLEVIGKRAKIVPAVLALGGTAVTSVLYLANKIEEIEDNTKRIATIETQVKTTNLDLLKLQDRIYLSSEKMCGNFEKITLGLKEASDMLAEIESTYYGNFDKNKELNEKLFDAGFLARVDIKVKEVNGKLEDVKKRISEGGLDPVTCHNAFRTP